MKTYNIPRVHNGPATLQNLNSPIEALQSAVNDLSARLQGVNNKSAIIQSQVPINVDQVSVGDLVYFDTQKSLFRPAIAILLGEPGSQGQSVQSPKSRVQGLVLSVQKTDKSAVLLRNGYFKDDLIQITLGNDALPGQYFLSPTDPGKATADPGWNLRQPCISYYGDGKFSLCTNYLAHDNHHHGSSVIKGWSIVQESDNAPQGARFYHEIPAYQNIGQLCKATTAVFLNGTLNTDDFQMSPSILWYKGTEAPADGSVIIFNNYPFAYGDSVVRSISSSSIDVRSYNGNAYIQMPSYIYQQQYRDKAISDITGNRATITPIVSDIIQGPGIKINKLNEGKVQINCTQFNDTPIVASDMYLNGTQRVAKGILVYTVFPALKTSYFVMSLAINEGIQNGSKINIKPWVTSCGPGATRLSVQLYWVPTYLAQTPALIPTEQNSIAQTFIDVSNFSTKYLQYKQSSSDTLFNVQSAGTIIAKVQAVSPTYDMFVHQAGFRFEVNNQAVVKTTGTADVQVSQKMFQQRLTYNANY